MKIEIKVPQLPESVSEATLLNWHKKQGEFIKREENLIDLETDKVVMELPAPEDGALVEVLGKPGDVVTSGQIIAYLDTDAKPMTTSSPQTEDSTPSQTPTPTSTVAKADTINAAMPAAAKIAADNAVNLANVTGSGRGSRILKEDVLATMKSKGTRIEERVPMTRLRKRVAERLVESQQTNAILTTFNEVNMKPIMDLRAKYKEAFEKKHNVKLGFMSFFVKAAIHALKQYPVVNASVDGDNIVYHGYFD
ncbi:MAG: 2-oxo acid dehydrogenase subunit E2, partial [Burkholderiales bacterium]